MTAKIAESPLTKRVQKSSTISWTTPLTNGEKSKAIEGARTSRAWTRHTEATIFGTRGRSFSEASPADTYCPDVMDSVMLARCRGSSL